MAVVQCKKRYMSREKRYMSCKKRQTEIIRNWTGSFSGNGRASRETFSRCSRKESVNGFATIAKLTNDSHHQ